MTPAKPTQYDPSENLLNSMTDYLLDNSDEFASLVFKGPGKAILEIESGRVYVVTIREASMEVK